MKTQHYQLKLEGLEEAKGQIKARDLQRVLDALLKTAERATRLMATGDSKGGKSKWLENATNFVVTGLRKGSTILTIDAPELGSVAREQFEQADFWREAPVETDTSLTLAALAIEEALSPTTSSERFDSGVLEAALELQKAAKGVNVSYELIPTGTARGSFKLNGDSYATIESRKRQLPEPRAFIVSGRLDQIQYSKREFKLVLSHGQTLRGRIHQDFLSEESLRPLWGNPVTIEGLVHFQTNGTPRFIDARKLSAQTATDAIFDQMPSIESVENRELFPELIQPKKKSGDPMSLWNTWPGDESIEELMAELD